MILFRTHLGLAHLYKVEIRRHREFIFLERRLHRLPFSRGLNDLPVVFRADAHRHRELWLIRLPTISDGAVRELQLQNRDRGVAQVLIEDRRQVPCRSSG